MGPPSDSGVSNSSFGSGVESASSERITSGEEAESLDETSHGPLQGVWGLLYTVSKEKHPSLPFVTFRLFFDWLQLFLIVVSPAYGWDIPADNKVWQVFSFVSLNEFMRARGYTFFIICLYIFAAALAANVALCIWVSHSFQQNKFDHVWPIVWLRYFSLIFYQVLDVASLSLFLIALDCQYFSVPEYAKGINQEFEYKCWSLPYLIHAGVAATSLVVFFILATVFTMSEIELNPVSRNLMGMAHTKVEGLAFLIKTIMTCTAVFINSTRWSSVIQLGCTAYLTYMYFYWAPHLHNRVNYVRTAYNASVFYAALLLVLVAYTPGVDPDILEDMRDYRRNVTVALWAGFIPVGVLGGLASYFRLRFFLVTVVKRFKEASEDVKPKSIYKFTDPREVEIVSRCCRKWVDEDTLDEESAKLAEQVIKAGMAQLQRNAYMVIWYSSFLIDVQGSYQSGYVELQAAKKVTSQSFLERFCIFIRDQEHMQKASAATSGDQSNVDLVSYVEFQRNYRLVMRLHIEALQARRLFWESLLHPNCSFDRLAKSVARIEVTMMAAERMYKQVLSRHGHSVKILLLWVKFLQSVKNDPWSAARWQAEADKLQRAEEEANERAVFEGGSGGLQNHDDTKGIIVMSANCLIKMANDPAAQLLGYGGKTELVGKNVNMIVPPPFARNHNNYVRNYIQTGKAKILDNMREFVALHKDRYVVPIQVFVTKVSGIGEDSTFLGVFSGIPAKPNVAIVWVMNGGLVLSCDGTFTDWLGYKQEDLHAKPVSDLVVQKAELDALFNNIKSEMAKLQKESRRSRLALEAQAASDQTAQEGGSMAGTTQIARHSKTWFFLQLKMKHMYLDNVVAVDAEIKVGGIGETALYVLTIRRTDEASTMLMVSDAKGRIVHATTALANQLGTNVSKMQAGNTTHALDQLLPPPLTRIHHNWYHDKSDIVPPYSCRSGLSIFLPASTRDGMVTKPFSLSFRKKDVSGREAMSVVTLTPRTIEEALDERRLRLVLNSHGIVTWAGGSPEALFGFEPQALVGHSIAYVIDVLRPTASNDPGPSELLEAEEQAAKVLFTMAERTYGSAGLSWRVGVSPIIDPVQIVALGPMGVSMVTAQSTVAAVLTVSAYMEKPQLDGARMQLPSELKLAVELWRADMLSGCMEIDSTGVITMPGVKDMPTFVPGLLLGVGNSSLLGQNLGAYLPLHGKPLMEALFTEGALGSSKSVAPSASAAKKSGMKPGSYGRRRAVGPVHHVRVRHQTDGEELELRVQAVIKQDVGSPSSVYVTMHVDSPRCGRSDFRSWINTPVPPPRQPTLSGRRSKPTSVSSPMPYTLDRVSLDRGSGERASGERVLAGRTSKEFLMVDRPSLAREQSIVPSPLSMVVEVAEDEVQPVDTGFPTSVFMRASNQMATSAASPPPRSTSISGRRGSAEQSVVTAMDPAAAVQPLIVVQAAMAHELAPVPLLAELPMEDLDQRASASTAAQSQMDAAMIIRASPPKEKRDPEASTRGPRARRHSKLANDKGDKGKHKHKAKSADADASQRGVRWHNKGAKSKDGTGKEDRSRRGQRKGDKHSSGAEEGGDGSDDSDGDNSRSRVESWMLFTNGAYNGQAPGTDDFDSRSGGTSCDGSGQGGDGGEEGGDAGADDDDESSSEAEELDEAESGLADYKRGKRFKRLSRMLASPQAQSLVQRMRFVSFATVAVLLLADLSMFVAFMLLVRNQMDKIHGLDSAGGAAIDLIESSISVASLNTIYSGRGTPGVRYLSSTPADRDKQLAYLEGQISDLNELHRGVYDGPGGKGGLPTAEGLKDLWDQPVLRTVTFYDTPEGVQNGTTMAGLWDAGNSYIKAGRGVLQNSISWNASGLNFSSAVDPLYVLWNGPEVLAPAYYTSLDDLVKITADHSKSVNDVQLIILAIEGGLLGLLSAFSMWQVSRQLTFRRYAVYSVFMIVPLGVVRSLATAVLSIDDRGEEPEALEAQEANADNADEGDEESGKGSGAVGQRSSNFKGKFGTSSGSNSGGRDANAPAKTLLGRIWQYISSCWNQGSSAQQQQRRVLLPSRSAAMVLVYPFMVWGAMVIGLNAAGFSQLEGISHPIAMVNIINVCSIRAGRVVFYAHQLVTASPGPLGKDLYRATLQSEYRDLRKEYDAMLYGKSGPLVVNDTSLHYTLAEDGVMFSSAMDILYSYRGCMCEDVNDCQDENSPYYRFTNFGLDQLMKQFNLEVETLLRQPDNATNVTNSHFKFVYEIGLADVRSGLVMLSDKYNNYVDSVYMNALSIHIAIFVLGFVLASVYVIFVMRPVITRVAGESKRIAELLSNLPPDLDIEKLVAAALKTSQDDKIMSGEPANVVAALAATVKVDALVAPTPTMQRTSAPSMTAAAFKDGGPTMKRAFSNGADPYGSGAVLLKGV